MSTVVSEKIFHLSPGSLEDSVDISLSLTLDGSVLIDFHSNGVFVANCDQETTCRLVEILRQASCGELECDSVDCEDLEEAESAMVMVCGCDKPKGVYCLDYTSVNDGVCWWDMTSQELGKFADSVEELLNKGQNKQAEPTALP